MAKIIIPEKGRLPSLKLDHVRYDIMNDIDPMKSGTSFPVVCVASEGVGALITDCLRAVRKGGFLEVEDSWQGELDNEVTLRYALLFSNYSGERFESELKEMLETRANPTIFFKRDGKLFAKALGSKYREGITPRRMRNAVEEWYHVKNMRPYNLAGNFPRSSSDFGLKD